MSRKTRVRCFCVIALFLGVAMAQAKMAPRENSSNVATTTVITGAPNPVLQGDSVTLTVTVSSTDGDPTGEVEFEYNSAVLGVCTLAGGTCSFSASSNGIAPGTYNVTANYAGGSGFSSSVSKPLDITVEVLSTSTSISASPNPVVTGGKVMLIAFTVPSSGGYAPGKVNFLYGADLLGSCTLDAGSCSFSASSAGIGPGTYAVIAKYTGSSGYLSSTSPAVKITVEPAEPPALTYNEIGIHNFAGKPDGDLPGGPLVADSAGSLYGTTSGGGASAMSTYGAGTVYKISSAGQETVLYSFTGGEDGGYPSGGVVLDSSGNIYGTYSEGNPSYYGGVFKLTPAGVETVLYPFKTDGSDGYPLSPVILDSAGNLYGITQTGGTAAQGSVFEVNTTTGAETTFYSFTGGSDGGQPNAYYMGLALDASGQNLYGTTTQGGYGYGVVFKINLAGKEETVVYNFASGSDGSTPYGGVALDASGNIYGTTQLGGASGVGTVFKVSPAGAETILYSFTNGADGGYPETGITLDSEGNIFGATGSYDEFDSAGYPEGYSNVFEVTTKSLSTIFSFTGGIEGMNPEGNLLLDAKGNLYGVSYFGGAESGGIAFELSPPK